MYELKRVQSESRWLFSEFEKQKNELQMILGSVNIKDSSQNQVLQQTVSIVNLDTKVSLSKNKMPDTIMSATSRNAVISPFSQTRADSSQSLFQKTCLSKLPILRSKREYMTARNISRNSKNWTLDNDTGTIEGIASRETEGELILKEYLTFAQLNSNSKKTKKQANINPKNNKNLHLKSGLSRKHSRFNEEIVRSKSDIKLNSSKKDSVSN